MNARRFFLAPSSPESRSSSTFSPNTYKFLLAVFCIVSLYSVGRPSPPCCCGRFPLRSGFDSEEEEEECSFKRTEILALPSGVFLHTRGSTLFSRSG